MDDLSTLTMESLEELRSQLESDVSRYNNMQMARKIAINAAYGAAANSWFLFYSMELAEAITYSGQLAIKFIGIRLNAYLNKIFKTNNIDYIIAQDTDSVVGESLIYVDNEKVRIQEFFDSINSKIISNNGNNIKCVENDIYTKSVNTRTGDLEQKKIKYVMKHKVSKRMFSIKSKDGKEVIITQDHSIIVRNNDTGVISEITPLEINPNLHSIITKSLEKLLYTNDYTITDLGIQEIDVYDIEVEDNHNFFANDICVHNSCYLTFDRLVELVMPDETDTKKIVAFLTKVTQEKINPFINKAYEELKQYTNAYEQKMSMKTESISDFGIWKAKKRYALNIWWDEGVVYETPELKIKGIEAVQSTTPAICRDAIKKCLYLMLADKKQELYKFVTEFEKEFRASPFEKIATTTGIHALEKYMLSGEKSYGARTPIHVRASILYNDAIKKAGIDDVYQRIMAGDKMKYCYMKLPNPIQENVFGIFNKLPPDLGLSKYIDYEKQFDAEFIEPVNSIAKILGWDIKNKESIWDYLE